jgi:signal transduction histidine kinase
VRVKASDSDRRLLVVDDNPATLYSTSRMLRNAGFEVVEAKSGEEALERVADSIDLVVLDINLPGIDGFEVCRRIRSRPEIATMPVVHLSASFVEEEDRETGYDAGADGYLTHPVEPVVLVGTVNAFLRTRQAETARRAVEQERERLLESERAARQEAERANELKDQFLAMLSHELRNPLNVVVGWAQVLRTRYRDPDLQKGLSVILNAANAQAQLISDLLEISRITAGKLSLDMAPVQLCEAVASTLEAVEGEARAKGIQTHFAEPCDPVMISADAVRLQQVVWNLLHNAVKFTPAGGRIDVAVNRRGSWVDLVVTDNGVGMSPDFLPHVFERFRQADGSTRRRHGGLGLGLTIVRLLAEAHGGSVRAHSAGEGQGATFTVTLPVLRGASVPASRGESPDHDGLRFDGVRVLVVEDDEASRDFVVALLNDRGAVTAEAASADEALALLESFAPQLLVSDIGMPLRDGLDLLRTIRAGGTDADALPAIALTAFASSSDRDLAIEAGFQRHIPKPIRADQLLVAAAELLGRSG